MKKVHDPDRIYYKKGHISRLAAFQATTAGTAIKITFGWNKSTEKPKRKSNEKQNASFQGTQRRKCQSSVLPDTSKAESPNKSKDTLLCNHSREAAGRKRRFNLCTEGLDSGNKHREELRKNTRTVTKWTSKRSQPKTSIQICSLTLGPDVNPP